MAVKLGDACDFIRGVTFEKNDATLEPAPGRTPILRAGNIADELDTRNDLVWVADDLVANEQLLRKNDIAICMSSGSSDVVGKTARAPAPVKAAVGSFCGLIRPKRATEAAYLSFFFRSSQFRKHRDSIARGANIQNLRFSQFEEIELSMPNDAERIAAILERADRLRRLRRYGLEMGGDFLLTCFVRQFGDPISNAMNWKNEQLEELCDLVRGSSPRPQGDPRFFKGPVPRLMIADITRDGTYVIPTIDSLTTEGAERSRPMNRGSVVMAVSGDVGLPAILGCDACIHDGFVGFRELNANLLPIYFYFVLKVRQARNKAMATGAIWQNLNTDQVKEWRIPIPPRSKQEEFVELVAFHDRLSAIQRESLRQAEHLFQALLQQAFTSGL